MCIKLIKRFAKIIKIITFPVSVEWLKLELGREPGCDPACELLSSFSSKIEFNSLDNKSPSTSSISITSSEFRVVSLSTFLSALQFSLHDRLND